MDSSSMTKILILIRNKSLFPQIHLPELRQFYLFVSTPCPRLTKKRRSLFLMCLYQVLFNMYVTQLLKLLQN